jgi:hypothetical protein
MESETKPNKAQYGNGQKESLDPAKITKSEDKAVKGIEDFQLKVSRTTCH